MVVDALGIQGRVTMPLDVGSGREPMGFVIVGNVHNKKNVTRSQARSLASTRSAAAAEVLLDCSHNSSYPEAILTSAGDDSTAATDGCRH